MTEPRIEKDDTLKALDFVIEVSKTRLVTQYADGTWDVDVNAIQNSLKTYLAWAIEEGEPEWRTGECWCGPETCGCKNDDYNNAISDYKQNLKKLIE